MKALFALSILTLAFTTMAQTRQQTSPTRVEVGGGRSTIRIEVGRQDIQQNERINRLEQAVRDLQDQVWDLRDQDRFRTVETHICTIKDSFRNGIHLGKAPTRLEAERNAYNECVRKEGSNWCKSTSFKCEIQVETIRY